MTEPRETETALDEGEATRPIPQQSPEAPTWYPVDTQRQQDAETVVEQDAPEPAAEVVEETQPVEVTEPVVVEEPVAEETVADEPVADEPAAEETVAVEEPAAEETVAVEEPAAEETVC